jgi:hypothetical protein
MTDKPVAVLTDHAKITAALGLIHEAGVDAVLREIARRSAETEQAIETLASYCPEADPGRLTLRGVVGLLKSDVLDRKADTVDGRAAYDKARIYNGWFETWDELPEVARTAWHKMAATQVNRADYDTIATELAEARTACVRATEGPWVWAGDGEDELDSMTSDSVVSITVLQLRGLIEKARDEWRSTAMRYQARHAGLRGLQLAVTDATKRLNVIADSGHTENLDAVVDQLVEANRVSAGADSSEALIALTVRDPGPLPSVETLRQWMVEKTPVFLTFESGKHALHASDLPTSGSITRGVIAYVSNSGVAVDHDGTMHAFDFTEPKEEWKAERVSWLISIGPRRDTVLLPIEQPWGNATDPIIETWVGRKIECMSAHTSPWTCTLLAASAMSLLISDPSGCFDTPRNGLQVRLVSEVAK